MKNIRYTEKLVENFIRDYPKKFLGIELNLLYQQPILYGFVPDLIFEDANSTIYIVEVQIGKLDRRHLYKNLEYKDLYLAEIDPSANIKMIVFCNSIPERYNQILKTYQIKGIAVKKEELIKEFETLDPSIRISKTKREFEKKIKLTSHQILDEISKSSLKTGNSINIDAMVFYQFQYNERYDQYGGHLSYNLKDIKDYPSRFFFKKNYNLNNLPKVPIEIIVSSNILNLNVEKFFLLKKWLANLGKCDITNEFSDVEVILGHFDSLDAFEYRQYVKNRIKTFKPLWKRYSIENHYDNQKISEDLEFIKSLGFYLGKYPNYKFHSLFEAFEVNNGAGSLEEIWEIKLFNLKQSCDSDTIDRIEKEHRTNCKKYKWSVIKMLNLNLHVLILMDYLMLHISSGHMKLHNGDLRIDFSHSCHICPIKPKKFSTINVDALKKTSKYFEHG